MCTLHMGNACCPVESPKHDSQAPLSAFYRRESSLREMSYLVEGPATSRAVGGARELLEALSEAPSGSGNGRVRSCHLVWLIRPSLLQLVCQS